MTSIDTTRGRLLEILNSDDRASHEEDVEVILAEYVVIPRSELPKVKACPSYLHVDGQTFSSRDTPNEHRRAALNCLAIAEHFDAQAATESKRNARRDELTAELVTAAYGADAAHSRYYADVSTALRGAVDRIIELEEAAA